MSTRPYKAVHAELMEADRERARVLYRLMGDTDRMTDRQYAKAMRVASDKPEYKEADRKYQELSEELRRDHSAAERRSNARLARRMGL